MSSKQQEPPDYAAKRAPDGWPDLDRSISSRAPKSVQTNIENFSGTAFFLAQPLSCELQDLTGYLDRSRTRK